MKNSAGILTAATAALLLSAVACSGSSKQEKAPALATVSATIAATSATPTGAPFASTSPAAAVPASPVPSAIAVATVRATQTGVPPAAGARSAAVKVDPCALVSQAEAGTVLGAAAGVPHTTQSTLLAQCQYSLAVTANADDNMKAVTVQVFPNDQLTWKLRMDTFMKTNKTVEMVSGVGDEAFWVGDQSALFVLRKGVIFDVRVPGNGPAALDAAKSLGQKAAGRV